MIDRECARKFFTEVQSVDQIKSFYELTLPQTTDILRTYGPDDDPAMYVYAVDKDNQVLTYHRVMLTDDLIKSMPSQLSFEQWYTEYDVDPKRYPCSECDGEGKVDCLDCGGDGICMCDKCGNEHACRCDKGRVDCSECNGEGHRLKNIYLKEKLKQNTLFERWHLSGF